LNNEEIISNNEVRLSERNFALEKLSNMIESENKTTEDDSVIEIEVENKSVVEEIKVLTSSNFI
jgi:hypothetical protein